MTRPPLTPRRAWGAVGAIAGHELRRRVLATLAIGLAAGLIGVVVLGALSTARRTATAYDRLVTASGIDDVRALVFGDEALATGVAGLDGVARSWVTRAAVAKVDGPGVVYSSVDAGGPPPPEHSAPVVIAGRQPRPDAAEEVLVVEGFADQVGLAPGDQLALSFLTVEEMGQFDTGFGEPDGPTIDVDVVGIARSPGGTSQAPIIAGPAFAERYGPQVTIGYSVHLVLTDGPDGLPALQGEVDELIDDVAVAAGAEEFVPVQLSSPTADRAALTATARVLAAGQLVLALLVALAGVIAIGQALARHHAAGAADQQVEMALGLTMGERVLARLLAATPAIALATIVAGAGAVVVGRIEPLGAVRRVEPHPGWAPNVTLAVVGALLVGAAVAALVVRGAWLAGRPRTFDRRTGRLAASLVGRAPRPVDAAGVALAVVPGGDPAPVPVRSAATGAVLGVAGVVAAATFGAGLARLVDTPDRWGWSADLIVVDVNDDTTAELAADPRVGSFAVYETAPLRLDGTLVDGTAVTTVFGEPPGWTVLTGRAPVADDEVMLGSRDASVLDVEVGDRVTLGEGQLRVVGIGIGPTIGGGPLGEGALVTAATLTDEAESAAFNEAHVTARSPDDVDALVSSLADRYELTVKAPPADVRNLDELGALPVGLAVVLGLVALGALIHALMSTVRRRSRDLAILRAIGFTPRQVAETVTVTALTTAAIGVLVGVPLGVGLGRLVWWAVADATGVAADPAVPVGVVLAVVVAVPVIAMITALVPAARAARIRPAAILAGE